MHLLECIALLMYLETKLKINQRVQVEISVLEEMFDTLIQINTKVEGTAAETSRVSVLINDLLQSTVAVRETAGILYLPDKVRDSLVDGVTNLCTELCVSAYRYFTVCEIPSDICTELESGVNYEQSPMEVLRRVASTAIARGLY